MSELHKQTTVFEMVKDEETASNMDDDTAWVQHNEHLAFACGLLGMPAPWGCACARARAFVCRAFVRAHARGQDVIGAKSPPCSTLFRNTLPSLSTRAKHKLCD